jgi:hypothetical protein
LTTILIQTFVDMSISSTINMPAWGTPANDESMLAEYERILIQYLPKIRGITVYPDGARGGQPLSPVSYSVAAGNEGDGRMNTNYQETTNRRETIAVGAVSDIGRRIAYSNVATSTTSSGGNAYQHVRFIDESITAAQANCIDGSIVLASIFRKIGLNVSIILAPNHAYVALSKDDDSEFLFAIETTMVASASLEEAIEYGTEKGPLSLAKIGDKLGAENDSYQEINLRIARKIGVQPIPFSR